MASHSSLVSFVNFNSIVNHMLLAIGNAPADANTPRRTTICFNMIKVVVVGRVSYATTRVFSDCLVIGVLSMMAAMNVDGAIATAKEGNGNWTHRIFLVARSWRLRLIQVSRAFWVPSGR